ncbi:MAG: PspC domain-containing protein [Bacteroidales bacterium]|nr:PspC domain-containing protein [Bacteroidales bacterium]
MKKTVKINLGGLIFNLDEDAFQVLKNYLDAIISHFRDQEEGKEIIEDIEARMAELFQSKVSEKKEVITLQDVNDVIEIMGKPEELFEEKESESDATDPKGKGQRKQNRKLYRDPDNAILGGVACGLAAWFGIEAWVVRLLLIIFTIPFQVFIIVYIILWIVLPKAETAAQKLEMRGERVTVSNIEKTVKEEYETVKDNVKRVRQSKEFKKTRSVLDDIFHIIGRIFLVFLKIILFIIGISLIIAGISAIMGLTGAVFFSHAFFPIELWHGTFYNFHELFGFFTTPTNITLFAMALIFAIIIPVVALIYGGIKLIFRFKAKDKVIGLTALVLWILSIIFLVTMSAYEGTHFLSSEWNKESEYLENFDSDTLYIYMESDPGITGFNDSWFYEDNDEWHIISGENKVYGKIDLDIEYTDGDSFEIVIYKKSQGQSRLQASINADHIEYDYVQDGSSLILDPYFSIDKEYKWRDPDTEVNILVPEGKYIYLEKTTQNFLDNVDHIEHGSLWKLPGKTWKMTGEGLEE